MAHQSHAPWAALGFLTMLLGACATAPSPQPLSLAGEGGPACRTASAAIHFDFPGASSSACAIEGERAFALLVTPEHAPPINPSPWYAFRYEASGTEPVTVTLRYLGGRHRYSPKWKGDASGNADWRALQVETAQDKTTATFSLPPGSGTIAAQEIITASDAAADLARWSAASDAPVIALGRSHDGRPIEALRLGRPQASRLVILIGRQHPPEVTGAIAMRAFVDALVEDMAGDRAGESEGDLADVQFLIVPLLNPDGAARGHWRANRGAVDLNRDWGTFSQPETQAVKAWLDALPQTVRPALMIDFHSTYKNLFYVQGDEASAAQRRFLAAWLGGREEALPSYPFTIEPRDANPGSGTTKNWFFQTYGIAAYTYEVGDDADREGARAAAATLARGLPQALKALEGN